MLLSPLQHAHSLCRYLNSRVSPDVWISRNDKKMDIPNVIVGVTVSLWRATCESALHQIYRLRLSFYLLSNFSSQPENVSCIPEIEVFLSPVLLSVSSFQVSAILSQFLIICLLSLTKPALPAISNREHPWVFSTAASPQVKITDITMTACQIFVQLLCIIYIRLHFWNALQPRSRARLIYLT